MNYKVQKGSKCGSDNPQISVITEISLMTKKEKKKFRFKIRIIPEKCSFKCKLKFN